MVSSTLSIVAQLFLSFFFAQTTYTVVASDDVQKFPFLMPNVRPYRPELYLCTPIKVDYTRDYYIVGFEPNATMDTAHHMLLYGCGEPGSDNPVWNCGEMASSEKDEENESASPCHQGSHSQIIYAWARDAPKLELPEGVGFKVGESSPIKYMILQVHYAHVDQFKDGRTDDSGIFIQYTQKVLSRQAGVLLLGTTGFIPPMKTEHMETACKIEEDKEIYPFAYRTHTHSLGKVVSAYRVITNDEGEQKWLQLGKRDPLTPQMFYPVNDTSPISKGDIIAARCTMESTRTWTTYIGATGGDEMCNLYLMYYVKKGQPLKMKFCFGPGPPTYYWKNPDSGLRNIPEFEASHLD